MIFEINEYFYCKNIPTLTILNKNANRESAPLSLWIVSATSRQFPITDDLK